MPATRKQPLWLSGMIYRTIADPDDPGITLHQLWAVYSEYSMREITAHVEALVQVGAVIMTTDGVLSATPYDPA